jgi:cytochrome c oxidase subunit 1
MGASDAPSSDEATGELAYLIRDALGGAIAGGAGSAVLLCILYVASRRGFFDIDAFGSFAGFVFLDAVAPPVLAGVGLFLFIGMVVWPLLFLSIESYLPGRNFPQRGMTFGVVLWTGFAFGFYPSGYSPAQTALYLVFTLFGHLAYGFFTGNSLQYLLSDYHLAVADANRPSGTGATVTGAATGSGTDADAAVESGADDGTGATGLAADGRSAAASRAEAVPEFDDDRLPPLLQFSQAIAKLDRTGEFDGVDQFDQFQGAYGRLVDSTPGNRSSIINDLNYHVTGLRSYVDEDSEAARWLDSVENRLTQYRRSLKRPADSLRLTEVQLLQDGQQKDVADLQEQKATLRAVVRNQGERSGAVINTEFRDENGILLRTEDLSMGYTDPGEQNTLETDVYVPSIAASFEAEVLTPEGQQAFRTDR